jgi:CubicO group peptidase (beta-lactamase class C family)
MDRFVDLLDGLLDAGHGSAAALSIGDGGREVLRTSRGFTQRVPARGAPIDEHSLFDVASLTKPMATAALAMTLVADGKLDLAAPIRRWLGNASSEGTVLHLLGHAAGYVPHVELFRRLRDGDRAGASTPYDALVAMAAAQPVGAPPGEQAAYSDLGYIVLGAILERAADQPLAEAFAERIAGPLALAARFPGAVPIETAVATEVVPSPAGDKPIAGVVHDENARAGGGVAGHAGLFATLDDVARFGAAICDAATGVPRGRLRPDVVEMFLRKRAAPDASWRLGWDTPSAEPGVSHAGDRWPRIGAVGHLGFTGTSLWLDLPHRRWVALLTNRVHPTRDGSAEPIKQLRRAVHDAAVELLTTVPIASS